MARTRQHMEDLAYAEEHRLRLPELYIRTGHRCDMADRDWTEFCNHCKQPIAIIETMMDKDRNLIGQGHYSYAQPS